MISKVKNTLVGGAGDDSADLPVKSPADSLMSTVRSDGAESRARTWVPLSEVLTEVNNTSPNDSSTNQKVQKIPRGPASLFYDKTKWTGVHKRGGPTIHDKDALDLRGHLLPKRDRQSVGSRPDMGSRRRRP